MRKIAVNSSNSVRASIGLLGLLLLLVGSNTQLNWRNQPIDTVVLVNQQPVTESALKFARQRSDRFMIDVPVQDRDKQLLQRLIDDELILQRAEELGILRADPGIRKLLARSAINTVVRESQALLIKEPQLIAFYNNHQAVFQKPQRITLQAAQFNDLEMANISRNAVLLGDSLKKTVSLVGGKILPIPVSPLPKHMLIRYLGISLTDLALGLSATQISQPILQGDNIYLLHVVENQPATLMPFEQVRETVMTELISRQRRDSLTMTLEELKQTASIQLNLSLLGQLASTDK
ncbi:MAG: peptidyl-prolyl cis-trans isomerase [Porticoccaceae bacterium]|nr:peptidyl-prolyl cis-trans isomerase [Porticoccaceae bacterium]